MQVNAINNHNNRPKFGAKIVVKSQNMKDYMSYLKRNTKTTGNEYNSKKDLELTNKIFDAFAKHPSKEKIVPDVAYLDGVLFNARGTIKSSKAAFIDTEPARSDSIAPIQNVFRRILDPKNKKSFNKLVGEEHSSIYNNWWKENIAPIWKDIKENFREQTFFKENHDKEFNADFNRESGNKKDFSNQQGNHWVKLYKQNIG